jgi:hypothetical protein
MATAPSPNDLTRQQLDELDALLQRMLTLPVNPPEGGPVSPPPAFPEPAPVPNWRVDPPAAIPAPSPHLLATPLPTPTEPPRVRAPEPEPPAPPVVRAPVVSEPTPPPGAVAPHVPVVPTVPPPEPAAPVVVERPVAPPPQPRPAPAPAPTIAEDLPEAEELSPEPVPVALWPLVAFNWTVDAVLGLCGPPGLFLRSGLGKNLLGLAGIALIALTAAHVATDRGWVTLPFPVPWPR